MNTSSEVEMVEYKIPITDTILDIKYKIEDVTIKDNERHVLIGLLAKHLGSMPLEVPNPKFRTDTRTHTYFSVSYRKKVKGSKGRILSRIIFVPLNKEENGEVHTETN